jgi:membrane fusion protein (multidrug efflux system)
MTIKKIHALVAVVGIAVAAGAAYVVQRKGGIDGSGLASAATTPSAKTGPPIAATPITVEVAKVEQMRLEDDAQAVGSLRSRQGVMLRPEVSGRVSKIGFGDGQKVRRGQLLVQLDDTLQQAQLKQAQAQASIARTNLQRNRDLVAQNFVSQSAVDQTAASLEVADAQVALAQAQVARMRIVAPFDGIAGIGLVSTGDYVRDGADLANIEDLSSMVVDFRLPERVLSRLKIGQAVDVMLDGLPGRSFVGRVDALDAQLDANGRSLLVRAQLENRDGTLRAGMFARTRIVFAVRDNAIVVPEEALVPQGNKQFLVKVIDGADGKVTQRVEAKIGLRVPGKAEILEGLSPNDIVVTAGQARVMRADSLPIKVVEIGGKRPSDEVQPSASGVAPVARAPSGAEGARSANDAR